MLKQKLEEYTRNRTYKASDACGAWCRTALQMRGSKRVSKKERDKKTKKGRWKRDKKNEKGDEEKDRRAHIAARSSSLDLYNEKETKRERKEKERERRFAKENKTLCE